MRKLLLQILIASVLIPLANNKASAQECNDLLQTKIEQYYLNIRPKPDSLQAIHCDFIRQKLGVNDVFLDFLSTELNNEPIFFLTIIPKTGDAKTVAIPQLKNSTVTKEDSGTRSTINKIIRKDSYDNYDNLLRYFDQDIQNANAIYYSTTGDLNLVNLKYLKNKSNIPLFKKHHMVRLHTAVSFLGGKQQLLLPGKMNILLAGDIDYNCDTTTGKSSSFTNTWNYLPGTKTEIIEIESILKDHHIRVIDSCQVTETKFIKEINSNRYDVVHLATHGFFIETSDEKLGIKKETFPLDKSGIVLSGANNKNASVAAFNSYGLFTASDFTKIKLSNAKLVVLSTCHSGEGTSTQSGAPIGLILSLLRQGTTAMIVSNRAVNDNDARLFMTTFYSYLNKNPNVDDCFIKTLRNLHEKMPQVSWDFFDLIH